MELINHIKENFNGILVIADVHADYESFMNAYRYASTNNLFFFSLGDLVDRGPFPYETVIKMANIVKSKLGAISIGNHDEKYRRYYKGAKVVFSADGHQTFHNVGPERQQEFLKEYSDMLDTPIFSDYFHKLENILLVHGATHELMWDKDVVITNDIKSKALYGQVTNEKDDTGLPKRFYDWIDDIPAEHTVIVGHDRKPVYNKILNSPLRITNSNSGNVIFMDTACGKGGFLTGAVLKYNVSRFEVDNFIEFK